MPQKIQVIPARALQRKPQPVAGLLLLPLLLLLAGCLQAGSQTSRLGAQRYFKGKALELAVAIENGDIRRIGCLMKEEGNGNGSRKANSASELSFQNSNALDVYGQHEQGEHPDPTNLMRTRVTDHPLKTGISIHSEASPQRSADA